MTGAPEIFTGKTEPEFSQKAVDGQMMNIDGEQLYKICKYDEMRLFFMSLVSDSDLGVCFEQWRVD